MMIDLETPQGATHYRQNPDSGELSWLMRSADGERWYEYTYYPWPSVGKWVRCILSRNETPDYAKPLYP